MTAEQETPEHTGSEHSLTKRRYRISELAEEFDITTRAIRFYESEGLLTPQRRGRMRIYTHRDHTRLKLVLRGKRLGFTLSEVREMLELYDSEPGELGQLNHVLAKIAERRALLEQQLEDIQVTLLELGEFEARCRGRLGQMRGRH